MVLWLDWTGGMEYMHLHPCDLCLYTYFLFCSIRMSDIVANGWRRI